MSFNKREKVVLYRMNFGWSVSWSETFIIDTFLKGLFGGFLLVFFEKILHAFFPKVINRTVQINGKLRARLRLPRDADEQTALDAARDEPNVIRISTARP